MQKLCQFSSRGIYVYFLKLVLSLSRTPCVCLPFSVIPHMAAPSFSTLTYLLFLLLPPLLPFTLHFPVTQRIISSLRGKGWNLMRVRDTHWNALYPPLTHLVTEIVVSVVLWVGWGWRGSVYQYTVCMLESIWFLPTPPATIMGSAVLTVVSCSTITGPLWLKCTCRPLLHFFKFSQ